MSQLQKSSKFNYSSGSTSAENKNTLLAYFARSQITGAIKIGVSSNLKLRLSTLQTASGMPIELLLSTIAGRYAEKILLRRFSDLRLYGEWFRPEEKLLYFIKSFSEADAKFLATNFSIEAFRRIMFLLDYRNASEVSTSPEEVFRIDWPVASESPAPAIGKLLEWLEVNNLTQAQFAHAVRIGPSTLSKILSGESWPSIQLAGRISYATLGRIAMADWRAHDRKRSLTLLNR